MKNVDTSETTVKLESFETLGSIAGLTSSPRFAKANGEVERGVQTMKAILNKCDDEYFALLTYTNTPLHNGYSATQLCMGRRLKTRMPIRPEDFHDFRTSTLF